MSNRITLESFSADSRGFANVSLITGEVEAQGHGLYVDEKSVEGTMKALLGRSLRSHLRHDGAGSDRLGTEIGFFTGIYRDGMKVKARAFEFLEAFKREASTTYGRLVEMAQKVPELMGVSLVVKYNPAWVLADGTEIPAKLGDTAPSGAVRPIPSMRILEVLSGDLVSRGAANPNGLLSADPTITKSMSETTVTTTALDTMKAEHTAALAAKDTEIATVKAALDKATADMAALTTTHTTTLAEKDALIAKLTQEKDDATKQATELAESEKKLKATLAEVEIYDARKLGVAPIRIAQAQLAQKSAALKTPAEKLAAYEKMEDGAEKEAFRRANLQELFSALNART